MVAILIPAYNEAAVIESALESLLSQTEPEDEIIVACNGCSDDTAHIARQFEPRISVIDTPRASKTHALNLADKAAQSFPRIYLDADVRLAAGALDQLKKALDSGRWLALAPAVQMDFDQTSWPVRAYYDIWLSLPYCRSGMIGAGLYAITKEGRARFKDFPAVIADDGYVRALFEEHERGMVSEATAIVRAPAKLRWLVKIKTRSRLGGLELAHKYPRLMSNEKKDYAGAMREVMVNPMRWVKLAVYLYVNALSRVQARRRFAKLSSYQWEKDLSTRQEALKQVD